MIYYIHCILIQFITLLLLAHHEIQTSTAIERRSGRDFLLEHKNDIIHNNNHNHLKLLGIEGNNNKSEKNSDNDICINGSKKTRDGMWCNINHINKKKYPLLLVACSINEKKLPPLSSFFSLGVERGTTLSNNNNNQTRTSLQLNSNNNDNNNDTYHRTHTIQQIKRHLSVHGICCENASSAPSILNKAGMATTTLMQPRGKGGRSFTSTAAEGGRKLSRTYTRHDIWGNNNSIMTPTANKNNI